MKVLGSTHSVVNNKDYAQEYRKSKEVLGGAGDLSRDAILVMRRVNFDQNGKPKTEEDAKNHAWNKQWLKAIDEDDFELREKMLAEEIPNRFWIKDLPQPSKELLALHKKVKDKKLPAGWSKTPEGREAEAVYDKELKKFLEEMERYTEQKLEKNDVAFFYELESGQSVDKLRKAHPSLEKYLQDNPEINQRLYMTYSFMGMTGGYFAKKYYIDDNSKIDDDTGEEHLKKKTGTFDEAEKAAASQYLTECLKYQEVKKKDIVPYQMIITDEDRQRKQKRAALKAKKGTSFRNTGKRTRGIWHG